MGAGEPAGPHDGRRPTRRYMGQQRLTRGGTDRGISTLAAREGFEIGSSPHTWSFVDDEDLVEWFLVMSLD